MATREHRVRWLIVMLACVESGWLLFDGLRALITGDYVTPTSGPHAGQLGPWATVVSGVGLDPRATLVKLVHVGLGASGLVAAVGFALRISWGWTGVLGCAVLGLWYLPIGTTLGVVQIGLLLLPSVRHARG